MYLNRIQIKNFKAIKDIDYTCSDLNLITGGNGSGKSSVLQALVYAITAYLAENIKEYIHWYEKEFYIHVLFEHTGHIYDMEITATEDGTSKKLVIDEDSNQEFIGNEATAKLKEIIDPILTRYSAVSSQHEAAKILSELPSERLEKLKQILGIGQIQNAVDHLKEKQRVNKEAIAELVADKMRLENTKFHRVEIPKLEGDLESLEKEQVRLEKDRELWNALLKLYEEYTRAHADYLEATRINIQNKLEIDQLKKEIVEEKTGLQITNYKDSEWSDIFKQVVDKEFLLSDLEQGKIRWEEANKNKEKLEKEISDLDKKINGIKIVRLGVAPCTEEILNNYNNILTEDKIKLKELQNEKKLVDAGKCPTCKQDYHIEHNRDIVAELQEVTKEIADYENTIVTNREALNGYNKKKTENDKQSALHKQLEGPADSKAQELVDLVADMPGFDVDDYEDEHTEFQQLKIEQGRIKVRKVEAEKIIKNNEQFEKSIQEKETKIKGLEIAIKQIKIPTEPEKVEDPGKYDATELNEVVKAINIYEEKANEIQRLEKHNAKVVEDERKNLQHIKEVEKELTANHHKETIYKKSRALLEKEFPSFVIEEGTTYLANEMNKFFRKSYGRFWVKFMKVKSKVEFMYGPDETISKPVGLAGGYEQQLLGGAFRVATCSIQNLGFAVFDEIESDAEDDMSVSLYRNIIENNYFKQIFCITHKEQTKDLLRNEYRAKELML